MNDNHPDLDPTLVARLKDLSTLDAAAQTFFGWAAQRQYDASVTSIENLAKQAGADRRWAITFAKLIDEETGFGNFIVGRRGRRSRVAWRKSLRQLGQAVKDEI